MDFWERWSDPPFIFLPPQGRNVIESAQDNALIILVYSAVPGFACYCGVVTGADVLSIVFYLTTNVFCENNLVIISTGAVIQLFTR
jgi:hypothetical protein